MTPTITKTIKDRNCIAYLLANGFTCDFASRPGTFELDAQFQWTNELDRACMDYSGNKGVPVQSFVAACRFIGEQIKLHRQSSGEVRL
jgi:hypothetical protein